MASAPDCIDSLKDLPEELRRNFSMMLDLGSKTKNLITDVDKMADNYMSNIRKNSPKESIDSLASIQRKFDEAKELSDDKVQLSIQTYELVDKRIRELDLEMARFKANSKLKVEFGETATKTLTTFLSKKGGKKSKEGASSVSAVSDPTNPTNSLANVAVKTSSVTGALVFADMPIDPNEPKFCLCNDVSFGEMIGCDNPDCAIEWFHFGCVNLMTKPNGKWICPKCALDMKKK